MKSLLVLVAFSLVLGCQKQDKKKSPEPAPVEAAQKAPAAAQPQGEEPKAPEPTTEQTKTEEPGGTATTANDKTTKSADKTTETPPSGCGQNAAGEKPKGCGGGTAPADGGTAKPVDAGTTKHFGAAFTMQEDASKLGDIIAKADELNGKKVKVAARISKVCKKKGCWFVLADDKGDGQYVRVTMHNYSFFVPKDCDGKNAVVEGVFKKKDLPESARKHLAEDGGDDPKKVKGKKMELTLVASAIDIDG